MNSPAHNLRGSFAPERELRLRGIRWVVDGEIGKIRRRVTPSGETRFYLDFRPLGRVYSQRDALGEVPLRTRAQARALLERIRSRVEDGTPLEVILDMVRPDGSSHVERRAAEWIAAKRREADGGRITHASLAQIEHHVRRYWGPWKSVPVRSIRRAQILDWATWLGQSGLAPGTVRGALATFRAFMAWLEDREEIDRVPRFPRIHVPEHAPDLMSEADQERVLATIPEARRGIFYLLVDLAVRPNEARAVRPVDLAELEGGVPGIIVQRAVKGPRGTDEVRGTKTGQVRGLPLTPRLAAWIGRYGDLSQPFEPLFLSRRGRPWSGSGVNDAWQRACRTAGVRVRPVRESTRHSGGTRYLARSGRLDVVQKLLGHSKVATTQRYAKTQAGAVVELVLGAGPSTAPTGERKSSDEK